MRGNIIVRIEHDCQDLPPERRSDLVTRRLRFLSDAEILDLASRRERQYPGRNLHPVSITLPADVLERLQRLQGSRWSVSALIDRILTDSGKA
ncbi:hypothetical protein [Acidithiobacillus sulfuriphilus]|uniref:hypothetical protein n=1 Tax=Acidithiobacillus sulfuriphilus TaxID=1867749 RepID=UPI003F5E9C87